MKAYELFCQDVKGDELIRTNSDRRAYYNTLRQALRDELTAGAECRLLEHYAARLEEGAPEHMYLLDAAALWECYEGVLNGPRRLPRDIGPGLPFPMANGVRITWPEAQRQSDLGTLPVAVVDEALRARISALVTWAQTPAAERGKLKDMLDSRARLAMADARMAGSIPFAAGAKNADAADPRIAQLEAEVADYQRRMEQLRSEYDAAKADLTRMENQPRQSNEELVHLVDLILRNNMADAAALAQRLGGEVHESVQRMQKAHQAVAELQEQLTQAQEQEQADTVRAQSLRAQLQAARQRMEELRTACEQAQTDALKAQEEKKAAEKKLTEARETLQEENARLREIQARMARVSAAADLTRRQADHLS